MLYRFASAGSGAAVNAGVAAVRRALPAGSVAGAQSWLAVKAQENESIVPWVPFLVTFGVIGLVDVGADRGQRGQRRGRARAPAGSAC